MKPCVPIPEILQPYICDETNTATQRTSMVMQAVCSNKVEANFCIQTRLIDIGTAGRSFCALMVLRGMACQRSQAGILGMLAARHRLNRAEVYPGALLLSARLARM